MKTPLVAAIISGALALSAPQQTFAPDAEGFIRNWLVLAPIPIEGDSGASEIDRDMLKGEASIKPKAGDKTTVGGRELVWTAHQTSDFYIDFRESFGKDRGEYVAGYAVAYVLADEETKVTLLLGTNDQGKIWLNGKAVSNYVEPRTLEKDADRADVTLVKGQNVLVLKIINEVNNWQACARFVRGTVPARDLKISLTPQ